VYLELVERSGAHAAAAAPTGSDTATGTAEGVAR
jgi:hypothetical protein